ncbi:hypothetical protein C0J52_02028 [Blattella germanica]|nr:hypothetical protein C0J52_02028 [Blattella germanica]
MSESDSDSLILENTPEKNNTTVFGRSLLGATFNKQKSNLNKSPIQDDDEDDFIVKGRRRIQCIQSSDSEESIENSHEKVSKSSHMAKTNGMSRKTKIMDLSSDDSDSREESSNQIEDSEESVEKSLSKSSHVSKTSEMHNYRKTTTIDSSSSSDESDYSSGASNQIDDSEDRHKSNCEETSKYRNQHAIESSDSDDSNEKEMLPNEKNTQSNKSKESENKILSSNSHLEKNQSIEPAGSDFEKTVINESKSKTLTPKRNTDIKELKCKTLSPESDTKVSKTLSPKGKTQKEILAEESTSHKTSKNKGHEKSSIIIIDDSIDTFRTARDSVIEIPSTARYSDGLGQITEDNFQPHVSSTPFRNGNEFDQVTDLESSFGAIKISDNKKSQDSSSDLIAKKKQMQSDMAALTREVEKVKMILRTVNISHLADRGVRLQVALNEKQALLKKLQEEWQSQNFDSVPVPAVYKPESQLPKQVPNEKAPNSQPGSSGAIPKRTGYLGSMPSTAGMGKRALETHMAEKAMTVDTLKHLHGSLKSCPGENVIAEDPQALRSNVQLMQHQRRALAWLLWRESHKPHGGILADDMGLGKTLTMISLILKAKEKPVDKEVKEESDDSDNDEDNSWHNRKYEKGGTLVVCPASLINQWEGEVKKRVKRGVLDVEVYHGQSRETKPRRLARRDMVVTTYNIVRSEGAVISQKTGSTVDVARQGALFRVKWDRIILDEGHTIRNYKSQTAVAICALKAKYRWALTGTPIHNKELDLYSLLKFLRCSPFDDLHVWRRWIDNKSAGGIQRLNTVINSLMLRRTKDQLQSAGKLSCLPTKEIHEICVKLDEEELEVYQTILNFSRTLFQQFLAQKVEREQMLDLKYGQGNKPTYMQDGNANPLETNEELKMLVQKMNSIGDIKSYQILVLLLRLRQVCCHAGLIESMLDDDLCKNDGIEDEGGLDVDLLSQLNKMGLEDKEENESVDPDREVKKRILVSSNPVFNKDRISSKKQPRFYSDETIEQQIRKLQIKKLELASVLTGGKRHQVSKLSMEDLKMLFNFK